MRTPIRIGLFAVVLALTGVVAAEDTPAATTVTTVTDATTVAQETSRLSEGLIYSVDRTPENPFATPRAVEVITIDDIWRTGGMTLSDVLLEVPGFYIQQSNFSGGAPVLRGLMGKQVLMLIDGVKVNNSTWRSASKEYLNIIDLSQVERVEVVRGVVSVLGTDSLGGVINIITRKGPMDNESFGGTIGARFSSGADAYSVPLTLYGKGERYRFFGGATYHHASDLEGGGNVGTQALSGWTDRSAYGTLQYFVSSDKTISLSHQSLEQSGVQRAQAIAEGTHVSFKEDPLKFELGSVSYQDLTSRPWADAFRTTVYYNRQEDTRDEVRSNAQTRVQHLSDIDTMFGGSIELGKFAGKHHLVYGLDYSRDKVQSTRDDSVIATGAPVGSNLRGRYTDGARYQTAGIYLNDRFDLSRWLTVSTGVRYGTFSSSGSEQTSVGNVSVDTDNSDFTGALNVVAHATPSLNLIFNGIRGFRAPNLDDISKFSERREGVEVPNPTVGPEHVNSMEVGFKYETQRYGASGFYYRNELTDLLVRAAGTLNGLSFFDLNGNGVRDTGEPAVLQSQNIGEAEIRGIELGGRWSPSDALTFTGNYNKTTGDDLTGNEPLQRIPPVFGSLAARWINSTIARRPWLELVYRYAGDQKRIPAIEVADPRIGPNGTPGFNLFTLRGGLTLTDRVRLTAGIENLTNEKYKYHGSFPYHSGRQLVLSTDFRF